MAEGKSGVDKQFRLWNGGDAMFLESRGVEPSWKADGSITEEWQRGPMGRLYP